MHELAQLHGSLCLSAKASLRENSRRPIRNYWVTTASPGTLDGDSCDRSGPPRTLLRSAADGIRSSTRANATVPADARTNKRAPPAEPLGVTPSRPVTLSPVRYTWAICTGQRGRHGWRQADSTPIEGQPAHRYGLFPSGPGRTTTPETFNSLMTSLEEHASGRLPDATWIHPGHGNDSTVGAERPGRPGLVGLITGRHSRSVPAGPEPEAPNGVTALVLPVRAEFSELAHFLCVCPVMQLLLALPSRVPSQSPGSGRWPGVMRRARRGCSRR